jgi:hypothetical protein
MSRLRIVLFVLALVLSVGSRGQAADEGVHLFILSGQSNMERLDPNKDFTPAVAEAFGADKVVVIKDAKGAQPIRRWYKEWKPASGEAPAGAGDLYDRLMGKVKTAIEGKKVASVTFVWMQGERDAREGHGSVYADSLRGVIAQIGKDLGRDDVGFVIGRINDFGNDKKDYPDWNMVREAQVKVAEEGKRGAWVDTDDLNNKGNGNDIHCTGDGYKKLGTRFAEKAIEVIRKGG